MTLKKRLRSPKTNQDFVDIPKLQVWKKIQSTGPSDNIVFLKNESAYDLENRLKVNKTKSIIHPLSMIIKCYIFASFVTIHLFFRIYGISKSFFNIFCPPVTLEIGSMSPKYIHFFCTPKLYTHLCLALINQAVKNI